MNARKLSASWRSPFVPALAILLDVLSPGVARADGDTEAAETAAARTLAIDGVKLAQADQCRDAVDKLDRAEKLKHSAIVLRYLGECQIKVGRWVEGSESLRKLLREPLPEGASPALVQAYDSAAITLREVKPRIPTMTIVVSAPPDTDMSVKVDGKEMADSVVGVALPADPGEHEIEVTAPGFLKATSTVRLAPSATATVALELVRDPSARGPATDANSANGANTTELSPRARPVEPARTEQGSQTGKVLGYVSYGVAAVGLGTGIFFGVSAMQDEKSLRRECPGRVCLSDRQDDLAFAKTKGVISTVGFAVAGGGIALGTVFFLTSSSSSSDAAEAGSANSGRHTASTGLRPRATIGLGSVALAADF